MRHIVRFVFAFSLVGAVTAEAQFFADDFSINPFGNIAGDVPRRWCERYHHVHWDNNPASATFNTMLGVDATCCDGWTLCGGCWGFDELFPESHGGSCGEPIDGPLTCPSPETSSAEGCRNLLISEVDYPGDDRFASVNFGLPLPLSPDCLATCAGCPKESVRLAIMAHPHCEATVEARVVREPSGYRLQIVSATNPLAGYPECAPALSETVTASSTFTIETSATPRYNIEISVAPSATLPLTKLHVVANVWRLPEFTLLASVVAPAISRPPWFNEQGKRYAFGGVFPTDFTNAVPVFDDFLGIPGPPEPTATPGPTPTHSPTPTPTPSPVGCGNNSISPTEVCDGTSLAGHDCTTLGFVGGTLKCAPLCNGFDSSSCLLPGVPPPDPETTAPSLDPTMATDFKSSIEFLYSGQDRVQYGVLTETIDPRAAAVARGRIVDDSGQPISMVRVSILQQPEAGSASTRADGEYDLVLNGGAKQILVFEREGYLTAHRTVEVPWQDYVVAPEVILVEKDPLVTTIDLGALAQAEDMAVARGSVVEDDDGERQAKLLIAPGTQAFMELPGGGGASMSTINVRATEFTVGPMGLERMPAELPPTTAYTYAVELTVDEAEAEGATGVGFSQPVVFYVENFLEFPFTQAEAVPYGIYDRQGGTWSPQANGRIVAILGTTLDSPPRANVDIDGDNDADNDQFSIQEREALARLDVYGTPPFPKELWRVEMTHFSWCDLNWPFGPPADADDCGCPPPEKSDPERPEPDECTEGSTIKCESQSLGESISIVGTERNLAYQSDRMPGAAAGRTLRIPLSRENPPNLTDLDRIELVIQVAGQSIPITLPAFAAGNPPPPYEFTWNGLDAYGRTVHGVVPVRVRIGYVYRGSYRRGFRFRDFPSETINLNEARREFTFWQPIMEARLHTWDARATGVGGWDFDVHHVFDAAQGILMLGNGERQAVNAIGDVVSTVGGGGATFATEVPATQTRLDSPRTVLMAHDGGILIGELSRVRRIDPNGVISTIAGDFIASGFNGDGPAPATQIRPIWPRGLDMDDAGNIYFADPVAHRVRKLYRENGQLMMVTMAGSTPCGQNAGCNPGSYFGDGGTAKFARLNLPNDVAVDPNGDVYVADTSNLRIRLLDRTDLNGLGGIRTVFGGNGDGYSPDGTLASEALMDPPIAIDFDTSGNLYVLFQPFSGRGGVVRRIATDGRIYTVAGNVGQTGMVPPDGSVATEVGLHSPRWISVAPDGSLLIVDGDDDGGTVLRRVTPDGIIYTVAGDGVAGFAGDEGPARRAHFGSLTDATIGPDRSIYVADAGNHRIRRVGSVLPTTSGGSVSVPSKNGDQIFVFEAGRHIKTIDALTGATLFTFDYDVESGQLAKITDRAGNETTIAMPASQTYPPMGNGTITAPGGQETQLVLDPSNNGFLASVTNPAGDDHVMTYSTEGLLESLTTPNDDTYQFGFDDLGRLIRDADPVVLEEDPSGSFKTLTRTYGPSQHEVSVTTAMGRTTTYQAEWLVDGTSLRAVVDPAGLPTTTRSDPDGLRTVVERDGTTIQTIFGPDPRFGMAAPLITQLTVSTPPFPEAPAAVIQGPVDSFVERTRTATLGTGGILNESTDELKLNGASNRILRRKYTRTIDPGPTDPFGVIEERSPVAVAASPQDIRTRTLSLDATGRVTKSQLSGLHPIFYEYDGQGRLTSIAHGPSLTDSATRTYAFGYDALRYLRLANVENPLGEILELLDFDGADRSRTQRLPGPDGARDLHVGYDKNGNLTSLSVPGPTPPAPTPEPHNFKYSKVNLETEYGPPQPSPALSTTKTIYDYNLGRQLELVTRPDSDTIDPEYDSAGRLASLTLPGTQGGLIYAYSTATGQLSSIIGPAPAGNRPVLTFGYAGFLPVTETWTCENPGSCLQGSVTRLQDTSFRLEKQRVNADVPSQATFTYDNDSLLTQVSINGEALTFERSLHPAGLITAATLGAATDSRSYNGFGEITSYAATFGTSSYEVTYEEPGSLRDKLGRITRKTETINGVTTVSEYAYDEAGRLQAVTRDDGLQVRSDDYEYDDNGNRVAHRVNGVLMAEGTYDGQDRLLTYGLVPSAAVYEYTATGELATKTDGSGTTTYEYDALGSLRKVTPPGGPAVEYTIDGRGRRVGRKVSGVEQRFLYDGQLRIVAELNAMNDIVSRFVYGTQVNVPELMIKNGQAYRIITDHLGSVRFVINVTDGTIAQRIDYDAFGRATLVAGGWDLQPFGFAGGLFDHLTGLVRFGARDYDPEVGRWTAKDPLLFAGGDTGLYTYSWNDPLNATDPTGECPWCVAAAVGAITGAGLDLALQLLANGGDLACIDGGSLLAAALAGAGLSGLGPTGFLLGRGGARAAQFGYGQSAGILNSGAARFGWSGPVNGLDKLSLRFGGRHLDIPGIGVPSGANPLRDGAISGALGGAGTGTFGDSCDCQ